MLRERVKVFLGNCVQASIGEWVSLPQPKEELEARFNSILNKYGEIIISTYEIVDDFVSALSISQYDDIFELNKILQKSDDFIALYIYSDNDLEFATEFLKNKRYLFFKNVSDLVELGEAVVNKNLLGFIPQKLINSGYIDYEQIGRDFNCSGIRLFNGLGAIGQISESNYQKWKHLIA